MENTIVWVNRVEFIIDLKVFDRRITCCNAILNVARTHCNPIKVDLTDHTNDSV
ncbi:hypothetical protein [Bacillus massilioanorexius]|uniref:hypothetical protein n=1 Tax=Bacillus massilioanorexius TaxID=1468413 RepID=UPI00165268F2|nr:hypothetical protein [Bacillus massilioanorexius]